MLFALTLWIWSNFQTVYSLEQEDRNGQDITFPNWMSDIDDGVMLRDLSIPGSHDTMAIKGFPITKAQLEGAHKKLRNGRAISHAIVPESPKNFVNYVGNIFNKIKKKLKNSRDRLGKEKGFAKECILSGHLYTLALCLAVSIAIDGFTTTQDLSLRDQYEAGVRVIDIRCGMPNKNEGCDIYHEVIDLSSNLRQVLETTKEFLAKYPSEFILMGLNHEVGAGGKKKAIEDTIKTILALPDYRALFVEGTKGNLGVTDLGDLRGKIVIITGFDLSPIPTVDKGSKFANTSYQFEGIGIPKKIKLIEEDLDNANNISPSSHEFYRISLNYAGSIVENVKEIGGRALGPIQQIFGPIGPRYHAQQINPVIFKYISSSPKFKRTGIVMMDFVTKDYAQQIIRINFHGNL